MFGLPRSGLLAQQLLEQMLEKQGYTQSRFITGFWKYKWSPIAFALSVDEFEVKYVSKQHTKHLIGVLKENYGILEGWEGSNYCVLTLYWYCANKKVCSSMPWYVYMALNSLK